MPRKYCLKCQPHYLGNAGIWTERCDDCRRLVGVSQEVADAAALLRRLRKEKGITQTELARMLGVCRALVSERENGHSGIGMDDFFKTANVLGFKVHINFEG